MLCEFGLLELVSQFRAFEFVGKFVLLEFLFAERLASDRGKNGTAWTAGCRADQGGGDVRYIFEDGCGTPHEAAYATRNATKKLITFKFLG